MTFSDLSSLCDYKLRTRVTSTGNYESIHKEHDYTSSPKIFGRVENLLLVVPTVFVNSSSIKLVLTGRFPEILLTLGRT